MEAAVNFRWPRRDAREALGAALGGKAIKPYMFSWNEDDAMDYKNGNWWVVSGGKAFGPYRDYGNAKDAARITRGQHNDEILSSGHVYRYGTTFIGDAEGLSRLNVHHAPLERMKVINEQRRLDALRATPPVAGTVTLTSPCCEQGGWWRATPLGVYIKALGAKWPFCQFCGKAQS